MTTFGKLMDPLADKLLIVAALVSLVSLDRLAAWIAMVIIARELAVTGLRAVAVEHGVVDRGQQARQGEDDAPDRGDHRPDRGRPGDRSPSTLLVYAALAVTIWSGVDYFFGIARTIEKSGSSTGRG